MAENKGNQEKVALESCAETSGRGRALAYALWLFYNITDFRGQEAHYV